MSEPTMGTWTNPGYADLYQHLFTEFFRLQQQIREALVGSETAFGLDATIPPLLAQEGDSPETPAEKRDEGRRIVFFQDWIVRNGWSLHNLAKLHFRTVPGTRLEGLLDLSRSAPLTPLSPRPPKPRIRLERRITCFEGHASTGPVDAPLRCVITEGTDTPFMADWLERHFRLSPFGSTERLGLRIKELQRTTAGGAPLAFDADPREAEGLATAMAIFLRSL